jgi:tight adherence protein B
MSLVVALLAGGLVFAAAQLLLTTRRRAAVSERLGWYSGPSRRTASGPLVTRQRLSELSESMLDRFGLTRRVALALGRAGVDRTPGAFALFLVLVAVSVFVFFTIVSSAGLGLILALAVPFVAWATLRARAGRRSRAFEQQLPEILDSMSASLKAGHGFDYALQTMAAEVADPAGAEFRRVIAEVHLGRTMEAALKDLGERVESDDLLFVLDAILVQRQVGGSLASLFELVSETVRGRESFRRKLRAITGMVRMSAIVLTAMPFVCALGLTVVNHKYETPLFMTSTGRILCVVTIAMMLIGGTILRRIGEVSP